MNEGMGAILARMVLNTSNVYIRDMYLFYAFFNLHFCSLKVQILFFRMDSAIPHSMPCTMLSVRQSLTCLQRKTLNLLASILYIDCKIYIGHRLLFYKFHA